MKRKTTATSKKQAANRARGRRNRQRGAELQRLTVKLANELGLEAYNRDRGGAQHEKGDVEIDGLYYGCKRRKNETYGSNKSEKIFIITVSTKRFWERVKC